MNPAHSVLIKDFLHVAAGRVSDIFLPELKKYAIISAGRSGSNLLVSLLKSTPKNIQHGEIVGEYQLQSATVRRRINKVGPTAYLDRRLSRMATEKLTGVKLLYRHLEDDYGEKYGIPGTGALIDHLLASEDIRVIHLCRKDRLAVLVSNRLAYETGEWVGGAYGGKTVVLPVDWVQENFTWLEGWENRIAEVFPRQRVLQMTYEELVSGTEEEMGRVFRFLELPASPVHSTMSRQNKRLKSEVIENYAELKEAFSGTRYASLFDG